MSVLDVLETRVSPGVTRMRTHWTPRPEWAGDARRYAWHLTFEDCVDLHRTAAVLQAAVRPASHLDLVPIERLHLTLADAGSTTDVSPTRARGQAEVVLGRSRTVGTGALVFSRVTVVAEGVVLEASAPPWLDDLARLVAEGAPGGPVWPHVSLAYSHGDADPEAVLGLLLAPDAAAPIVTRPRLTFLELRREPGAYGWEVIAQRPLTCH